MQDIYTLNQLKKNHQAFIVDFLDTQLADKLLEMGIFPGEKISVKQKSIFGGTMIIQSNTISLVLRKEDAQYIHISSVK